MMRGRSAVPRVAGIVALAALTACLCPEAARGTSGDETVEPGPGESMADASVTFYRDVLPILERHCQECHRPHGTTSSGMVAPMSLLDFDEVRPWALAIARRTRQRSMPPWFASERFKGVFEHERRLTDSEIETLSRWALSGAPAGEPARAGSPPDQESYESSDGWVLGQPDLVVEMPEPYWVADEVEDLQAWFEVVLSEDQLARDRWVRWIEFRPGNPELVHHGGASVYPLDSLGRTSYDPLSGGKLVGAAPGDGPDEFPPGHGKLVRKGSKIVFDLHYHKEAGEHTGAFDQSRIAIKWHTHPVRFVVRSIGVSSIGWQIPPRHDNWRVGAAHTFERDVFLLNMMPHMHSRGKAARYELIYPDASREVILEVPHYDDHWQMTYSYKQPHWLPAGTRLEVTMWFDNSSGNPRLRDSPDRPVSFGARAIDEMNLGWIEVSEAEPLEDEGSSLFESRETSTRKER